MRVFLFIIASFITFQSSSQKNSFDRFTQDTILLNEINFPKVVAFDVGEAIIYIEHRLFKEKLYQEWKGCRKTIKKRKRILDDKSPTNWITKNQLQGYEKQYLICDS